MKTFLPILFGVIAAAPALYAQTISPEFADAYTFTSFATPWGATGNAPVLMYASSDDLVSAYSAGQASGTLALFRLRRDASGHLSAFEPGASSIITPAPYIDGGLAYLSYNLPHNPETFVYSTTQGAVGIWTDLHPGGAYSTTFPVAQFGASGGTLTATPVGIGRSDNLTLIPNGGNFLTGTYSGDSIANLALSVNDTGIHLVDHAEGVGYLTSPAPHFDQPTLFVLDAGLTGTVSAFSLDAFGLPIAASKRDLATGIPDAFGLTVDRNGDILVMGDHGSTIYEIQGFSSIPEPYSCGIAALALLGFAYARRNR